MMSEHEELCEDFHFENGHKKLELEAGAWVSGRVLAQHAKAPRFHLQYHTQTKQRRRATLILSHFHQFLSEFILSPLHSYGYRLGSPDLIQPEQ